MMLGGQGGGLSVLDCDTDIFMLNLRETNTRNVCRERTLKDKKRDREEDEEDVYERRRLERRLRDKEAAYQEVRLTQERRSPLLGRRLLRDLSCFTLKAPEKLGDPGEEEVS